MRYHLRAPGVNGDARLSGGLWVPDDDVFDPDTAYAWTHSYFPDNPLFESDPGDANQVSTYHDSGSAGDDITADGVNAAVFDDAAPTLNNRGAFIWDGGASSGDEEAFTASLTQPFSVITVAEATDEPDTGVIVDGHISSARMAIYRLPADDSLNIFSGSVVTAGASSFPLNTPMIITAVFSNNSSIGAIDINGVNQITAATGTHTPSGISLGANFDQNQEFEGRTGGTWILDNTDIRSDSGYAAFINNLKTYYGIS